MDINWIAVSSIATAGMVGVGLWSILQNSHHRKEDRQHRNIDEASLVINNMLLTVDLFEAKPFLACEDILMSIEKTKLELELKRQLCIFQVACLSLKSDSLEEAHDELVKACNVADLWDSVSIKTLRASLLNMGKELNLLKNKLNRKKIPNKNEK